MRGGRLPVASDNSAIAASIASCTPTRPRLGDVERDGRGLLGQLVLARARGMARRYMYACSMGSMLLIRISLLTIIAIGWFAAAASAETWRQHHSNPVLKPTLPWEQGAVYEPTVLYVN